MDFTEYQEKAFSTCTPECFSADYLNLGLMSEIGELAGKLAKQVRGDIVSDIALVGELGDIAWFIAVRALYFKEPVNIPNYMEFQKFQRIPINGLMSLFLADATSGELFKCLVRICKDLGYSVGTVLNHNIKKLSSRQKRGVIQGDGDNR